MNAALIYRVRGRYLIWIAFACAIGVHLTAILIAENRSGATGLQDLTPPQTEITFVDNGPADAALEKPDEVTTPEQARPASDEEAFPEENRPPTPIHPRKIVPITPLLRSAPGPARAAAFGSIKALVTYAPRPAYPYEARRDRITGSGIAVLTLNSSVGNVIDVVMAQSTGSLILDNETVSAFRRWRFKPGVIRKVEVPITYTLTGASY
jgi:TonB family protein